MYIYIYIIGAFGEDSEEETFDAFDAFDAPPRDHMMDFGVCACVCVCMYALYVLRM
jgi:hypothetical protein